MLASETHSKGAERYGTGMKKDSKNATNKSKREAKNVAELEQLQAGLAEREANTLPYLGYRPVPGDPRVADSTLNIPHLVSLEVCQYLKANTNLGSAQLD